MDSYSFKKFKLCNIVQNLLKYKDITLEVIINLFQILFLICLIFMSILLVGLLVCKSFSNYRKNSKITYSTKIKKLLLHRH